MFKVYGQKQRSLLGYDYTIIASLQNFEIDRTTTTIKKKLQLTPIKK